MNFREGAFRFFVNPNKVLPLGEKELLIGSLISVRLNRRYCKQEAVVKEQPVLTGAL
ncbi:MAG TPA: hypothetical protein PLD20_18025 [Blastocatellia bacterium]|nr:hypothetical protein [Blastocatellia bacterium]HMX26156.1 hypothetical protein [Blastocatellia bacterium]HMY73273.1 hypothetical protein [Blastocatellia bacterium]HMZ19839.1 hypothetical protein [Blastocatellia bacterium]